MASASHILHEVIVFAVVISAVTADLSARADAIGLVVDEALAHPSDSSTASSDGLLAAAVNSQPLLMSSRATSSARRPTQAWGWAGSSEVAMGVAVAQKPGAQAFTFSTAVPRCSARQNPLDKETDRPPSP